MANGAETTPATGRGDLAGLEDAGALAASRPRRSIPYTAVRRAQDQARAAGCPPGAIAMLARILSYGTNYPLTLPDLAADAGHGYEYRGGIDTRRVRRWRTKLEAAGVLTRQSVRGRRGHAIYSLVVNAEYTGQTTTRCQTGIPGPAAPGFASRVLKAGANLQPTARATALTDEDEGPDQASEPCPSGLSQSPSGTEAATDASGGDFFSERQQVKRPIQNASSKRRARASTKPPTERQLETGAVTTGRVTVEPGETSRSLGAKIARDVKLNRDDPNRPRRLGRERWMREQTAKRDALMAELIAQADTPEEIAKRERVEAEKREARARQEAAKKAEAQERQDRRDIEFEERLCGWMAEAGVDEVNHETVALVLAVAKESGLPYMRPDTITEIYERMVARKA